MSNFKFFRNKKCYICKKQACHYISFHEDFYYLCENKECERKIMEQEGIFNGLNIKMEGMEKNGRTEK